MMKAEVCITDKEWRDLLWISKRREKSNFMKKTDIEIIKEEIKRAVEWHIMENTP